MGLQFYGKYISFGIYAFLNLVLYIQEVKEKLNVTNFIIVYLANIVRMSMIQTNLNYLNPKCLKILSVTDKTTKTLPPFFLSIQVY